MDANQTDAMQYISQLENLCIPVYAISLRDQTDRRTRLSYPFSERKEFNVTVVETCKHEVDEMGIWESVKKAICMALNDGDDVIVVCMSNHKFTLSYSRENLFRDIIGAFEQNAHVVLGGVSSFGQAIPVADGLFWIDRFQGASFIILYRSFFQELIDESFSENDTVDLKLSEMTSNKMVIYPFISIPQVFGDRHSTTSKRNAVINEKMYLRCQERLMKIRTIATTYGHSGCVGKPWGLKK